MESRRIWRAGLRVRERLPWPGADAVLAAKLGLLHQQTANLLRSSEVVPEATT